MQVRIACMHVCIHSYVATYRIVKKFGGKKVWRNSAFETLAKKLWRIQGLHAYFSTQ